MIDKKKHKIFCLTCGDLEIVDGKVNHPELENILISTLQHGFSANYIEENSSHVD